MTLFDDGSSIILTKNVDLNEIGEKIQMPPYTNNVFFNFLPNVDLIC